MSKKNTHHLWNLFLNNIYPDKQYRPVSLYDIQTPEVSEFLLINGFRPKYPGGRRFAVLISHDVDFLNQPFSYWSISKKTIKNALHLKWKRSYNLFKDLVAYTNRNSYELNRLLDFLSERELKSTFYFLALDKHDSEFQYQIEEQEATLQRLLDNGYEIGLHGSQNACYSYDRIAKERDKINSVLGFRPKGYRNHLLNFDVFNTWKYLEKAGFLYDTSLGFNNNIGFRNGMAYPYNPYCELDKRFLEILEIPLNIMDVVFTKQLKYNINDSYKAAIKLIDTVIKQGGVLTLLWHHNLFTGDKKKLLGLLFEYIEYHGGWVTTYQELTSYWLRNNFNKKVNDMINTLLKPDC